MGDTDVLGYFQIRLYFQFLSVELCGCASLVEDNNLIFC